MKIYLGTDHRGYFLKEKVCKWLYENKYSFTDMGAESLDLTDDYTKYASEVASVVSKEKGSRGILFCGSGVGVEIVANKFDGARAGIGLSKEQVEKGRSDDDMNILVLAADFTHHHDAISMIKSFLETSFSGKVRYKKRLEDIKRLEENN